MPKIRPTAPTKSKKEKGLKERKTKLSFFLSSNAHLSSFLAFLGDGIFPFFRRLSPQSEQVSASALFANPQLRQMIFGSMTEVGSD